MILIAIGSNLAHPQFGSSKAVCERALPAICQAIRGEIVGLSAWYRTRPVPDRGQPWYVNGVARLSTGFGAAALLDALHDVERSFGRVRGAPAADRTLDLDLLDHNGEISAPGVWPRLPHPRLHERAFVLVPLADCAPDWTHPETGMTAREMLKSIPHEDDIEPIP
jgi:2-amino-4-hydroxy-6-hydroxymethyldihydropteridine diphosphokinase